MRSAFFAAMFVSAAGVAAAQIPAQNSRPSAIARIDAIPAPRDVPYPGTVLLTVDVSDVTRGIFKIHERVPVAAAGDLVMLYPKWVPGGRSPRGDIKSITGFRASANGQALGWVRDTLDVTAFHIAIPE